MSYLDSVVWEPYREPLRRTLARTLTIAAVVAVVLTLVSRGRVAWPFAFVVMLWPSFGGHWVEVFFLNVCRPRVARVRGVLVGARLAVWFFGGLLLGVGMMVTAGVLLRGFVPAWGRWWVAGVGFVVLELVVHGVLYWRGVGNLYRGDG